MKLVVILGFISSLFFNRSKAHIVSKLLAICIYLGLSYYLPNLMIGYLSALIFKRITLYLNLNYNLALVF